MLNYILLLQSASTTSTAAGQNGQQSSWSFWVMMILIFVVFYFFMIRPQSKKQKELQKQRDEMKRGDKVVTAGGIYGIIKEVRENAFIIEIAKDITIKVDKGSVYASADDAQQAPKEADKK